MISSCSRNYWWRLSPPAGDLTETDEAGVEFLPCCNCNEPHSIRHQRGALKRSSLPDGTHNFAALKKLENMRGLSVSFKNRYPTKDEVTEMCMGCPKLAKVDISLDMADNKLGKIFYRPTHLSKARALKVEMWITQSCISHNAHAFVKNSAGKRMVLYYTCWMTHFLFIIADREMAGNIEFEVLTILF